MIMNSILLLHSFIAVMFMLCMKTTLSFASSESLSNDGKMIRCIERERKALLVFKQSVASEYDLLLSWNKEDEDCCKWKGVGCNNHTNHVTHLGLSSLISPFSKNLTNVRNGYTYTLLDLPYLNYLDLSNNHLAEIPKFIASLNNLQYLNLSSCSFDGEIPKFIGSLNLLKYLDLSNNYFTGVIPHELGNLANLQHLDLANNNDLKDGLNIGWLFNLSSLAYLDLSRVKISSPSIWASLIQTIPSISVMRLRSCDLSAPSSTSSNFSSSISILDLNDNFINTSIFSWLSHLSGSLVELDLGNNILEGKIPQSFCNMTALTLLNLHKNLLNGPIPDSFTHMTALTYLDVSENKLTGLLPKIIGNFSNLKVADFSSNNFTGNLEALLSGPFVFLQELMISDNQLTGSLPDITLLPNLRNLEVSSNQLNGYLPTVFEHHSSLRFFDLSNNHLRGTLPDFTEFPSLELIYLENNRFSGCLPDFTGCTSLQELKLGENQLTEWKTTSIGQLLHLKELDLSKNSISSTISEAHVSNLSSLRYMQTSFNSLTFEFNSEWLPPFQLYELSVASCKLGPTFPNWIRNQRYINHLDISNSQILDAIPTWFGNLTSVMSRLNLSSNNIWGKFSRIPDVIQEIDLSSNNLDGPLPPIPKDSLQVNLSRNKFSGTLVSLYVTEDMSLSFLDISHNQLFGALPDRWMHFQDIFFLNLGHNKFSGEIPMSMGHLVSLRTLILRNNTLYGELPASLRNCSSLGFVDFGLNKLSGEVPSWIGKELSQLYALILKSNRFNGHLPHVICHLSKLHFLDLSRNRISGIIPPCFGNFTAMIQKGSEIAEHIYYSEDPSTHSLNAYSYSYFDDALASWKGQEFECGRSFAFLKMIDLSANKLTGEIPIGITRLLQLKGLNLSRNRFYGNIPSEISQLNVLECLDLSTNMISGKIPQSMSSLNFLAYLNLSNNFFSGRIPSGTQLQGFNISTYEGNSGLCGKPLSNICPGDEPADQPSSRENEVDEDDSEYERWLHISVVLGFNTTFWSIIGTLVLNRRWRHEYFLLLENLNEIFCGVMAVHIARLQRKI